jgi:hypothetical protein
MGQNPFLVLMGRMKTATANNPSAAAFGQQSDMFVSQLHGSKYSQAARGNIFFGANQSGVTTSVALATTYVGLCLSNPAGNTNNLVVRKVNAIFAVAQAALTSIGLITGYAGGGITAHTTPVTPRSGLVGSTAIAATGKLDAACTLVGTPVWARWMSAGATATSDPQVGEEIDGGLVIPPGGYVAIGTLVASPSSGFLGSMEWEEVPVLV